MTQNEPRKACDIQDELLNAVLDGEQSRDVLRTAHLTSCSRCQAFASFVPYFTLAPVVAPPTPIVWHSTVLQPSTPSRWRGQLRRGLAVGVAASVLVMVSRMQHEPQSVTSVAPREVAVVLPTPTRTVATPRETPSKPQMIQDIKTGLSETVSAPLPSFSFPALLNYSASPSPVASESLARVPDSARASIEPITGTTKRAFNLFLRELPHLPTDAKSKQ